MAASNHISAVQAQGLSNADFENLAKRADPGYSVRAFGPDAGTSPVSSYMVAHSQHNAPVMPHSAVSAQTIKDFVNTRKSPLSQPNMYAGSWTESETRVDEKGVETSHPTNTYLDVSEAMPRTHAGRSAAIKRGVSTGEKAIGVINELGGYANEINLENRNPLHEWASTFLESPDYVVSHFNDTHPRMPHPNEAQK
jgi:hypothetical protein